MTVRNIFSPWPLTTGGPGFRSTTMYVGNPWEPGSAVWLQCTTKYVAGNGQSEFGIRTVYHINNAGVFEVLNVGTTNFGTWAGAWFIPRLFGVVVACRTFDAAIEGTLTMFSWE